MKHLKDEGGQMTKQRGFTLIELMVTITIMGIMAAFALPAMNGFMENQRLKTTLSNYANALTFARNEAIRQNLPVYVCGANISVAGQLTGNGCSASNWAKGVFVFADTNNDKAYTAGTDHNIRVVQSPNKSDVANDPGLKINISVKSKSVTGNTVVSNPVLVFMPNGQVGVKPSTGDNSMAANYIQLAVNTPSRTDRSAIMLLDPSGRVIQCTKKLQDQNTGNAVATLCGAVLTTS